MKIDSLVRQRFQELEQKAEEILTKKEFSFQSQEGVKYYVVNVSDFKGWITSALSLLYRVLGEDSVHYRNLYEHYQNISEYESVFNDSMAIFHAAKEDYEGGYLFNIRGLIKAEVFDDVLEQASDLLQSGYKDAACVMTGVTLETALKELCTRTGVAHGKLDKMNADLCKAGIYNVGMQKQITAWADRRNKAAHGDWNAYSAPDVEDMIRGVNRFIAENL